MILQSKLSEDPEYRIHGVCALLTDAVLCILRRDDKGLHASPLFGLRPSPSLHHVGLGVFDSCETQGRRRHERDSVLSRVELQGARKLRFYKLFIINLRLDPNPKLTESNQTSEFWIGSGSAPTKNMVWIRGGAEKNPTARFGLDLIKFEPAVEWRTIRELLTLTL
jgi:hypothetical protein